MSRDLILKAWEGAYGKDRLRKWIEDFEGSAVGHSETSIGKRSCADFRGICPEAIWIT